MAAHKKKASKAFRESVDSILTLQSIPMPADTIAGDYISAGWLLSQMDLAAGKRAHQYTHGRAVTVAIDAMSLKKPVFVGDLISINTEIVRQGRTSLTMKIETWANRRGDNDNKLEKVTEGLFTFVAVNKKHKPVKIKTKPDGTRAATIKIQPAFVRQAAPGGKEKLTQQALALRMIPMPRDANYLGDIFGGWILSQMDLACAKTAEQYANNRVATVGLQAMTFHKPVFIGDEVSFYTNVVSKGDTSVTVRVETWSERYDGTKEKVTEGVFSYVALDKDRKPVSIVPHAPGH